MHVVLDFSDIDRTYRIGRENASSNKPRAAIIKLVGYNTRKRIISIKKQLKGTQVSIAECLTAKRMGNLKETRDILQFHNMWMTSGKTLYKDGKDNKVLLYHD